MTEKELNILDISDHILGQEHEPIPNIFNQGILDLDRIDIRNHHRCCEKVLNEELMEQYNMMIENGVFDNDKMFFEKRAAKKNNAASANSTELTDFKWQDERDELRKHLAVREDLLLDMHLEAVDPTDAPDAPLPLSTDTIQPPITSSEDKSASQPAVETHNPPVACSPVPAKVSDSHGTNTREDPQSPAPSTDTINGSNASSDTVENDPQSFTPLAGTCISNESHP